MEEIRANKYLLIYTLLRIPFERGKSKVRYGVKGSK